MVASPINYNANAGEDSMNSSLEIDGASLETTGDMEGASLETNGTLDSVGTEPGAEGCEDVVEGQVVPASLPAFSPNAVWAEVRVCVCASMFGTPISLCLALLLCVCLSVTAFVRV